MVRINKFFLLFLGLILSCSESDRDDGVQTLKTYLSGGFEQGAVIACAATDAEAKKILTFFYPEAGARDIRIYQTDDDEVDKDDYSKYTQVFLQSEPVFNGYLGMFPQESTTEKWIVITFELEGEIKISNPIRSKQITKPTVWHDDVTINQENTEMPVFTWEDDAFGDNAIYFQVISDHENNLLSATYTLENQFQYYKTSNVVLNITTEMPPVLISGNTYNFTLMDVSEDNWVNSVISKTFKIE